MKMQDVSVVTHVPETGDIVLTAQYVECFRRVYAEKPWNEWLKCPCCEKYWGTKDKALLASWQYRHCGETLVDFWSRADVLSDFYQEITSDALCSLAIAGEKVVGFCSGYPIAVCDLEQKIGIRFGDTLENYFGRQGCIGYQDEIGVLPKYQGFKIGKVLNRRRVQHLEEKGMSTIVSRARRAPNPSVTFLWYTQKLGYQILAEYSPEDGRVILGRRIEGLVDLLH